jgi:hypothetical protein
MKRGYSGPVGSHHGRKQRRGLAQERKKELALFGATWKVD